MQQLLTFKSGRLRRSLGLQLHDAYATLSLPAGRAAVFSITLARTADEATCACGVGPSQFHPRSPEITSDHRRFRRPPPQRGIGPSRLATSTLVCSLPPTSPRPPRLETSRLRPACRRPLDGGSGRARRAAPDFAARGGGRARRGKLRAARGVRVGPARAHPLEPFFVLSVQGGQLPDRDGGGEGRAEGGVGGRSLAVDGGSISLRYCVVSTND